MKFSEGKRATPAARKKVGKCRQIVLLDQGPLRKNAASECSRAIARLEKAKAEWKRFQQEDQTAFRRWVSSTFGALLSQMREIEAAVDAKEALVHEVEMELVFGGARSHRAAYRNVRSRRDHPRPEPPPPPREDETAFEGGPFGDIPEIEQAMLFEDFLRFAMGMDPDRMSKKKYDQMFAGFKANVLGQGHPEPPPIQPQKPEQGRIKELYRLLVRRLHPDTQADGDTAASAIWHEVQEAYSAGNVERLETLLAMTDLQANAIGEHTSLSQMRSVLAELRRSFNALQRNLRAAKKDPAWNFCALKDRSGLEKRVRREIKSRLQFHENLLRQLDDTIAQWSAAPKARKKPQSRQQTEFFY